MTDPGVCDRSPVRVFERAIGGGLGRGNIGIVLSRHGVGKTSFLIGLALDHLLQGRKVLHISTKETVDHLLVFYSELFAAMADMLGLDNRPARLLEVERNRHIHVYNRDYFTLQKLADSVAFMREAANFHPDMVILDGTPRFEHTERWEMEGARELARTWNAQVWTSAHTHREDQEADARGVPQEVARYDEFLAVITLLETTSDHVRVRIVKDHDREHVADLHMELDPQTRMLRWR
jgi:KaiC/GvpD/RAD55 family RecA-like ATPase